MDFDNVINFANKVTNKLNNENAKQFKEYVESLGVPFRWEVGAGEGESKCVHYFSIENTLPQSGYNIFLSIAFIDDDVSLFLHDLNELSDIEKYIIIQQIDELNSRYKFANISVHDNLIIFNATQNFSNVEYNPDVVLKSAEALMQVADSLFYIIKNNI